VSASSNFDHLINHKNGLQFTLQAIFYDGLATGPNPAPSAYLQKNLFFCKLFKVFGSIEL
jgi:hypothetical protein